MPHALLATLTSLWHAAWIVAGVTIAAIAARGAWRFHRAGLARLAADRVSRETPDVGLWQIATPRPAGDWTRYSDHEVL